MKIVSYNVNGIRAALKKGLLTWLETVNPDVICFQELKAMEDQIDVEAFKKLGYHCYWYSAQKKGYSGVAILSKTQPKNVTLGTGIEMMDFEGRNLRVDFQDFSIMSLYLPSGTNDDRLAFKLKYMDLFYEYIQELKKDYPNLIICGDYNICHKAIDIHNPVQNKNSSGFLPVEREWLDKLIDNGFIDSFRYLNSSPHHYSWWSYRANSRANNKGWRIDYNLVSKPLESLIKRAYILPEAKHSDHCPVVLEIEK